jgi:AmiR/NasT family two-component response regulator
MPIVNLYITEEEYVKLAYTAMQKKKRISKILQEIVRKQIEKMET